MNHRQWLHGPLAWPLVSEVSHLGGRSLTLQAWTGALNVWSLDWTLSRWLGELHLSALKEEGYLYLEEVAVGAEGGVRGLGRFPLHVNAPACHQHTECPLSLGTFDDDDKGREGPISYSLTDSSVLTGWKEGLGPKKKPLEPKLKPFL